MLEDREQGLEGRVKVFEEERETSRARDRELQELMEAQQQRLHEIAGIDEDEAREQILTESRESMRDECGAILREEMERAREGAEAEARDLMLTAMQRYAAPTVQEATSGVVELPAEELKGRIIGKDGRNIRSFEQETGVNLVVDDTPSVVTVSTYDPFRREIARRALEELVHDGRIHPASIEETVQRVRAEMEDHVREQGRAALSELGIEDLDAEVVYTLGQLAFRTSYGQNQLKHALEMAHLMGLMAEELGLDPAIARRIGLGHHRQQCRGQCE